MNAIVKQTINKEKTEEITIAGKTYYLLMTTLATKEISKHFGGIEKIGEVLENETVDKQLDAVLWLVTLLANQTIMINNRYCSETEREELLTVEDLSLFTTPSELSGLAPKLMNAINKGMSTVVESSAENESKNTQAG